MLMDNIVIITILTLLGLCFGSFANAAVWRLKQKKDIVKDRSECVHCHHKLAWYDLIPVLSWLQLKGRCRYCKKPISAQYPLVELAVAAYFVGSYLFWPTSLDTSLQIALFVLWLIYGIFLSILFVYDLRWYELPDRLTIPLIGLSLVGFALRVALWDDLSVASVTIDLVASLMSVAGLYYALYAVSKGKWVGFGDVKLGVFIGLVLGWQAALLSVFLANLLGFLVVMPGLLSGKLKRNSRIPFGPLLIAGFIIAGLFGTKILGWYLGPAGVLLML